jgi:hypothetical protein
MLDWRGRQPITELDEMLDWRGSQTITELDELCWIVEDANQLPN